MRRVKNRLIASIWLIAAFPMLSFAVTPAEQAFLDGQAIAQGAKAVVSANITNGSIANTVNGFNPNYYQYSTTAPEANFFMNGNGDTLSRGSGKITTCQTGPVNPDAFLQQNCEAINLMTGNTTRRPQFTINPSDPLITNSRQIQNNASTLAAQSLGFVDPAAVGAFTGCRNVTTTTPPTFTTEVCNDAMTASDQSCNVGRAIDVTAYANYECRQTSSAYETQTCNRTLNAVVTPTPYCDVNGSFIGVGWYDPAQLGYYSPAWLFDISFGCASKSLAKVTVSIYAGSQCHSGGCNSNYYPMTLVFAPGINAGPVTSNLAFVYSGQWHTSVTVFYDGATNTVMVRNADQSAIEGVEIMATAVPLGTCGVKNVITSSWINGCATQQAAAQ